VCTRRVKKTNFCYKDFILQHFKHCPLPSSPLYWRYTVPNVPSIVAQFSYRIFLNLRLFKKRPNFPNSSPTSKEGVLRLLSAPSGRFWQQTAISHVHKLFVGLIRRKACARAQFSGCSSTTNARSETGQMTVCCQNLPLCALSRRRTPSFLVGELFKKIGLFLNTGVCRCS
jgi:hypothetical protein